MLSAKNITSTGNVTHVLVLLSGIINSALIVVRSLQKALMPEKVLNNKIEETSVDKKADNILVNIILFILSGFLFVTFLLLFKVPQSAIMVLGIVFACIFPKKVRFFK